MMIPQTHWAVESGLHSAFARSWNAVGVIGVNLPLRGGTIPESAEKEPLVSSTSHASQLANNGARSWVGIALNPTDARCYRMIARLLYDDASQIPFNRHHTIDEAVAVQSACAIVSNAVYRTTGLFVQTLHLGNNSMTLDTASTGEEAALRLGKPDEPYFYHCHLLCRGNPLRSYFDNAPELRGPPVGVPLDIATGKVAWDADDPAAIALVRGLRSVLPFP